MKLTGRLGLAAAVVSTGVGIAAVGRRHRTLRSVAPDLRTRSLYVALPVSNGPLLGLFRRVARGGSPLGEGIGHDTRTIAGPADAAAVTIHVYESQDRSRPSAALLWIHAGGTIMGTPEMDHDLCSRFAAELGILVVSADYRLAPENPFPAGLDDCHAALQWLYENAGDIGVHPDRIAVGGASSGGLFAAALCQRVHDESGIDVAFQLLVYPALDDRTVLRSGWRGDAHGRGRIGWTPASNRYAWRCYLGHEPGTEETRPYAVPARRQDVSGLPRTWIGVGDLDLFHEEAVDYARRLSAAGVPCELYVEPGMYHGADAALAATVPSMRAFRTRLVDALRTGPAPTPAAAR